MLLNTWKMAKVVCLKTSVCKSTTSHIARAYWQWCKSLHRYKFWVVFSEHSSLWEDGKQPEGAEGGLTLTPCPGPSDESLTQRVTGSGHNGTSKQPVHCGAGVNPGRLFTLLIPYYLGRGWGQRTRAPQLTAACWITRPSTNNCDFAL